MQRLLCALWFVLSAMTPAASMAEDSVKIAIMEPLSGPFGLVGESIARHLQFAIEEVNAKGGVLRDVKLEAHSFDDKLSPQESVLLLKQIIDSGIRIVMQASGSNVAHALVDAIAKHNSRNPSQSVLLLNVGAQDPALTNEKCNFWHFRFEANTDMKLNALTAYMARQSSLRNLYLLNQDFAYGQAISRGAKALLAQRRPDVRIVGDDLHPLLKVKDFAPYVTKVKAAGADALLTGNGGPDLYLLIKAGSDAGLDITYYTLNAHTVGVAGAIGAAGANRISQVFTWHANVAENRLADFAGQYKRRVGADFWYQVAKTGVDMLVRAIDGARSANPLDIARALEGMRVQGDTGEVWMRPDDHQLIQPLYVASYVKAAAPMHDVEGTGYGWRTALRVDGKDTALPTSCRMERPQ